LKSQPRNTDALHLKGLIASSQGHHEVALALFDRAIAALPSFADAYFNKGNALAGLGRSEEALSAYERALAIKPGHPEVMLNMGNLLQQMGKLSESIELYHDMTRQHPNDARGHYNLAISLAALCREREEVPESAVDEVIAVFDRALALDGAKPQVHF